MHSNTHFFNPSDGTEIHYSREQQELVLRAVV